MPRFYRADSPPGAAAPPAAVENAEQAVENAEAAVTRAEATGDPKAISAAEARLKAAEDRLAKLETDYAELRQRADGKADADHAHEMPAELKALHEHISQIESEETPPKAKRHWLYSRIGGG